MRKTNTLIFSCMLILGGCAYGTIFKGPAQEVRIDSYPAQADIYVNGKSLGVKTPTTAYLFRNEGAKIEIRKAGCASEISELQRKISPVLLADALPLLYIGVLFGGALDVLTGGGFNLSQDEVFKMLNCNLGTPAQTLFPDKENRQTQADEKPVEIYGQHVNRKGAIGLEFLGTNGLFSLYTSRNITSHIALNFDLGFFLFAVPDVWHEAILPSPSISYLHSISDSALSQFELSAGLVTIIGSSGGLCGGIDGGTGSCSENFRYLIPRIAGAYQFETVKREFVRLSLSIVIPEFAIPTLSPEPQIKIFLWPGVTIGRAF